jgi:hypothetical protein
VMATWAPSPARSLADASPMPEAPPVTIATLPLTLSKTYLLKKSQKLKGQIGYSPLFSCYA